MRKDIAFTSKGLRCSGWLYVPDDLKSGQRAPVSLVSKKMSCQITLSGSLQLAL